MYLTVEGCTSLLKADTGLAGEGRKRVYVGETSAQLLEWTAQLIACIR